MLRALLLIAAPQFATVLAVPVDGTCQSGTLISGTTCTQECNTDRYGGDFASIQAASFRDCAVACNADNVCLTAQYNNANGFCCLKSYLNEPRNSDSVDGVVCRQSKPTPTDAPATCPTGATHTTTSGVRFEYTCGLDYNGGDLRAVYGITTIEACLDECAAEVLCLKSTWNKNSRVCYLKNGATSERQNPGDWGAKKLATSTTSTTTVVPSSSSSTSTTLSTITSASSSTLSASSTFSSSSTTTRVLLPTPNCSPGLVCSTAGYRYDVHCGEVVSSGGNPNTPVVVPNDDACTAICDSDGTCQAWSYTYETLTCTTYSPLGNEYTTQPDPQGIWALYIEGDCPL